MADTEIAATLTLNADQANQSVKEFKQEMKIANAELREAVKRFGELSPQAVNAAKKVSELKDRIKDAKEVTDLFDPGAKFAAFGNIVRGVTGGFTALTGALALFGGQSKEVEKALLKVQGALALTEGLNTIADVAKDFKRLNALVQQSAIFQKANAVATSLASAAMRLFGVSVNQTAVGFKILKGAIAATGIGLLVIGITALVNKISEWNSGSISAEQVQLRLEKAINKVNDALNKNLEDIEYQSKRELLFLRQTGATEKEVFEERIRSAERGAKQLKDANEKRTQAFEKERATGKLSQEEITKRQKEILDGTDAFLKKQREITLIADEFKATQAEKDRDKQKQLAEKSAADAKAASEKRTEAEKAAALQLETIRQDNFLATIEEGRKRQVAEIDIAFETERAKVEALKISEKEKTAIIEQLNIQRGIKIAEVDKKIAVEQGEREKEAIENLRKIREENLLAGIKDENERAIKKAEIDFNNSQLEIEALKVSEETKTALLAEANIVRAAALAEVDAKLKEEQDELKIELDEIEGLEQEVKLARLDQWYKDKQAIVKGNEDLELALLKSYEDQKTELEKFSATQRLNTVANVLGKAAELFGKHTAAGKVLAIAEATINTYTGMTTALREKSTLPQPFSTIQKIVSAGLILGTGLKAISNIAKTKVPGGGGSASTPSLSVSAAAPLSPQPQVSTTQLDQQTLNNTNNAVVRAYVNEADITNNQERVTRLNRAARLGG